MTEFVASNGWLVRVGETSGSAFIDIGRQPDGEAWSMLPSKLDALREFFQHERDTELGRWRSKEHPEYVVYEVRGSALVFKETECRQFMYGKHNLDGSAFSVNEAVPRDVAREFFAAHPEPKPWHDAQPGEVWALTVDGVEAPWTVNQWGSFALAGQALRLDDPAFLAGRRIWPEVSE